MTFLVAENVPASDLLSDVVQAHHAVLVDCRAPGLLEQVTILGMTRADAAQWLRRAADELEKPVEKRPPPGLRPDDLLA